MNLGTLDSATRAMRWCDLGPAQQAGMRCREPLFWAFLIEERFGLIGSEEAAAAMVRSICGVASRAELSQPLFADARSKWHQLDDAYVAWKVREKA